MILGRKGLPFYLLFFFYLWTATFEYGFVLGLHLSCIAFSFFILCTPMASYWYLLGGLPGALTHQASLPQVFSLWLALLTMNGFTIYFAPGIYGKSLIYRAVYSIITTYPINIFTLGFSGGTLLYHWSIFQLNNRTIKAFLQLVGVTLSFVVSYLIINQNHNSIVFYLMDMSNSNF